MRGPWARGVPVAVAGDERPTSHVEELDVAIGHLSARVGECAVTLAADRVPRATWVSMTRFARGMGPLEEAVGGRLQSPHLGVLLDEDWGEQLIPRPGQIRRTCSCPIRSIPRATSRSSRSPIRRCTSSPRSRRRGLR